MVGHEANSLWINTGCGLKNALNYCQIVPFLKMKEMSLEDEQRIAKEAADCYSVEFNPVCWMVKREGYIVGATAEHERMAELLKEEKNKAIQECIVAMLNDQDILFNGSDILGKLESFKR